MAPKKKPEDEEDPDETEFSEAQLAKLGGLVNAAVSKQLGRQLDKAVGTAIAAPLAELKELIQGKAKVQPTGEGEGDEGDDEEQPPAKPAKGKNGKTAAARQTSSDPAFVAMQRKLDAIEAERKTEKAQMAAQQRDGALREHLVKLGVKPALVRGAVAILRENTRQDDKTGEWSYIAKRDGYDEELDLGAGAKDWIGTDEGKEWVAPPEKPRPGGTGMPRVIGGNGNTRATAAATGDAKAARAAKVAGAYEQLAQAAGALAGGGDLPSS